MKSHSNGTLRNARKLHNARKARSRKSAANSARAVRSRFLGKLRALQYSSGLFAASSLGVSTGYNKAWIRDNIYEALGLEHAQDTEALKKTYSALFDIFLRHEYKIDYAIKAKPEHAYQYIHARYNPHTFAEFHEEWGNKQNDAIGAFLFKVADLLNKGIMVIRDKNDIRILRKLVEYLGSIEYWHDRDNGVWEENEEVHASSVGACVAGLKAISRYIHIPEELIMHGMDTLNGLLPGESETKEADMALLSLIYPYNIVSQEQKMMILENTESLLVREMGVIRYAGDRYYANPDTGMEAEWTMGFPWLAKIYFDMGDMKKYEHYLQLTMSAMNQDGELPELYYGGTAVHNENSPLGWSHALAIAAMGEA